MVEEKVVLRNGIKIIGSSPYFYSKNHGLKVWPLSDDVTMIKSEKFPSSWHFTFVFNKEVQHRVI